MLTFDFFQRRAGRFGGDINTMEDLALNSRQYGFISFAAMTILVGGLAFAGLLLYGLKSGQELPVWPAVAVAMVNLVAAAKIIFDVKKAKRLLQEQRAASALPNTNKTQPARRQHSS